MIHTPLDPLFLCRLVIPHLTSNPLGCNLLSQFYYISPVSTQFHRSLMPFGWCHPVLVGDWGTWVNKLPKVVTWLRHGQDLNPWRLSCNFSVLTITAPYHTLCVLQLNCNIAFILMAILQSNLGYPVPLWFSSFICSRREHLGMSGTGVVQARCTFLSLTHTQPCLSTEGKTKQWSQPVA